MEFDSVTKLLDDFDISKLLPDLNSMLGKMDLVLRVVVLLGPLVILALGLVYFLTPPREANYNAGYRFYWGMSSVECWRFTQRVAGAVWSLLGFGLLVYMAMACGKFKGMEAMPMVEKAIRYLLTELTLLVACCLFIDLVVLVCYNSKGIFRFRRKVKEDPEDEEALPEQPVPIEDEFIEDEDFYDDVDFDDDEYYEEDYPQDGQPPLQF